MVVRGFLYMELEVGEGGRKELRLVRVGVV